MRAQLDKGARHVNVYALKIANVKHNADKSTKRQVCIV